MEELKLALLAAANGNKSIEEKIEEAISAGLENIEERLMLLLSNYPILAVVEPVVKTYLSDIIKSSIPLTVKTDGKITIRFED